MSDMHENKGFAYQFNNLIFSNQKWTDNDHNRDFSPDFQNMCQEAKSENSSKFKFLNEKQAKWDTNAAKKKDRKIKL